MAEFQNPAIRLDVDDSDNDGIHAQAAFPRTLQILVSGARQVFPTPPTDTAQTLLLFAGTARFGQDGDNAPGEDSTNESSEDIEVDDSPLKTLNLRLRAGQFVPPTSSAPMVGSAAFIALGNVGLATESEAILSPTVFGAATNNAQLVLTHTDSQGATAPTDIWLQSDVTVEKKGGAEGTSQINRLPYQAAALLQIGSLQKPQTGGVPKTPPHGCAGVVGFPCAEFAPIDLDVNLPGQVEAARTLSVGINDGQLVFPADGSPNGANRLLIFTGTAICNAEETTDNTLFQGVVRVRLGFPVPEGTLNVLGSASMAALASFHANDEGSNPDQLFAVNAAKVVTDPTDGLSVPNPRNLPTSELYLIVDVGVAGAENGNHAVVSRIAYQANVLIQDLEPSLDSILVRPAGGGQFFDHINLNLISTSQPALWDFQLNLTGPVPQGTFAVDVQSDDPSHVQLAAQHVVINSPDSSTVVTNNSVLGTAPNELVTITATHTADTGQQTTKTATLNISAVPK